MTGEGKDGKVPYDDNIRFCHFVSFLLSLRESFDSGFAEICTYMLFVRTVSK
jgi:hypothetical protein